jgi:hypothetical protein
VEITADESLALRPAPALDLLLEAEGFGDRLRLMCEGEFDGTSALGVLGALAVLVLPQAELQVGGAADVVAVVGAPEDVDQAMC